MSIFFSKSILRFAKMDMSKKCPKMQSAKKFLKKVKKSKKSRPHHNWFRRRIFEGEKKTKKSRKKCKKSKVLFFWKKRAKA